MLLAQDRAAGDQLLEPAEERCALLAGGGEQGAKAHTAARREHIQQVALLLLLRHSRCLARAVPGAGGGFPAQHQLFALKIARRRLERRRRLAVAAVEADGVVGHAAFAGGPEDIVDRVRIGREAGGLAVVVHEEEGHVIAGGQFLEGGEHAVHGGGVHLVGPAGGAAEGVDNDEPVAERHLVFEVVQAAEVEGRPARAEVEGHAVGCALPEQPFLEAAGRVLERQVEHRALFRLAAEHRRARGHRDGDLEGEPGLAELGAAGEDREAHRQEIGDDKAGRREVDPQQVVGGAISATASLAGGVAASSVISSGSVRMRLLKAASSALRPPLA
jgi:hypothetical protein